MATAVPKSRAAALAARERGLLEQLETAREKNKPPKIVEALRALAMLRPQQPKYAHRLGDVLRKYGKVDQAAKAYERAALAYAHIGQHARARAMAGTLLSIAPERKHILERIEGTGDSGVHTASLSAPAPAPATGMATPRPARRKPATASPPEKSTVSQATSNSSGTPSLLDLAAAVQRGENIDLDQVLAHQADESANCVAAHDIEQGTAPRTPRARVPPPPPPPPHERPVASDSPTSFDLREIALFSALPESVCTALSEQVQVMKVVAGTTILRRGSSSEGLYAMIAGEARVQLGPDAADAHTQLGRGDIFGESCLLNGAPCTADVVARSDSTLVFIAGARLRAAFVEAPALEESLIHLFSRRLLANLMTSSPLFCCFDQRAREEIAEKFTIRRAPMSSMVRGGGMGSSGLVIPLTGRIELVSADAVQGRGRCFVDPGGVMGQRELLGQATAVEMGVAVTAVHETIYAHLCERSFTELAMVFPPFLEALAVIGDASDAPDCAAA